MAAMPKLAAAYAFDAFEALPDPAVLLAADGGLVRANEAFRAAFRHWIGPERPPWGRARPPDFETDVRRFEAPAPDGRQFEWVERLLADGARLAVARDITQHARAAEEALRAKTTLFATLTHELRTPLNGILGMAGLLAMSKQEPNAKSYTEAIRQSGEMLLDLITEILDYSRLDAGRIVLEQAPFDPEAAMQDVAELLSPKAHAKGLEIAVTVRAGAPACVMGDDGRLRQILFNLAGNAVKFTEHGGVVLEMAPRPGGRVRFSVRDTGPGVANDKQELIFEEFSQADAGIARRYGGAGLGLAIVKRLANAMGGEAGLASKLGGGATFWVELPLREVAAEQALLSLEGVRVCVLSTSSVLVQALRAAIGSVGGVIADEDDDPDVILLDWSEDIALSRVTELKARARVLIALIAQEDREAIVDCRAAGVLHYTLKPVRRRSLVDRIQGALGDDGGAGAGSTEQTEARAPRTLSGLRVLVAEDNPINALLARTLLSRAGCAVVTVQDGEEAVAAAATAGYDLILLDIRMPRLDGVGAAQRIRSGRGPSAAAPIIALTADAGEADRARAMQAGMDAFITKPIDAARLFALAERFTRPAGAVR
jgi:signal transduction histidine kinase/DNA-binding response OmpR family regulator